MLRVLKESGSLIHCFHVLGSVILNAPAASDAAAGHVGQVWAEGSLSHQFQRLCGSSYRHCAQNNFPANCSGVNVDEGADGACSFFTQTGKIGRRVSVNPQQRVGMLRAVILRAGVE